MCIKSINIFGKLYHLVSPPTHTNVWCAGNHWAEKRRPKLLHLISPVILSMFLIFSESPFSQFLNKMAPPDDFAGAFQPEKCLHITDGFSTVLSFSII